MKKDRLPLILVLLFIGFGCNLSSGPVEMVLSATEVGAAQGEKISKEIGPGGGTLSSADGRLTLTVPAGALTETLQFAIQPITNKAGNGLGLAYRLEPNGKVFPKPLQLTVKYDEKDMEGTMPEAFTVAYQDEKGAWHAQKASKLDQSAKTVTISVTHFSDWAFMSRIKLSPAEAKIKPGDSVAIALVICDEPGFLNRILSRPGDCSSITATSGDQWTLLGPGHLTAFARGNVTYEAPPRKPSPNIANVVYTFEGEWWNDTSREIVRKDLIAKITILGNSFRATGSDGSVTYSGTICSLDEPFKVTGNHPIFTYPFQFTPTSQTEGTMTYGTAASGITASGSGTYTIVGRDTETPKIVIQTQSTARSPVVTTSGGGKATILLTPLEGDECG